MKRFKKILCYAEPVEQTRPALIQALQIASKNQVQLTLASLVDEVPVIADSIQNSFVKIRTSELEELLESVDTMNVSVDIDVLVGNLAAIDMIKKVIDEDYDLVVKPADNTVSAKTILFGTNDQHLLRKCPVPVWIIKPQSDQVPKRILAAIDVDPAETENVDLNKKILQLSTSLAEQYDSKLHVIHAWNLYGEEMLRQGRSYLPKLDIDRMINESYVTHKSWLDSLLNSVEFKDKSFRVHLEKGEVDEVISGLVQQLDIDLIVMGTVARTGIPGFFIGNSAERILSSIDCSVLAVKPDSFQSPVRSFTKSLISLKRYLF